MVSNDQDGKDYVKNYVRPSIELRMAKWNNGKQTHRQLSDKVIRYYRPQPIRHYGHSKSVIVNQPKTHCVVYMVDRIRLDPAGRWRR